MPANLPGARPEPGGVAQLGERLNGIQEVSGSIPLASTGGPVPPGSSGSGSQSGTIAGIAQLVEHNLAKVGVAGSSPVSRFVDSHVQGSGG